MGPRDDEKWNPDDGWRTVAAVRSIPGRRMTIRTSAVVQETWENRPEYLSMAAAAG